MNTIELNTSVSGSFIVQVLKGGKVVKELPVNKNLLLDKFFERWKTNYSMSGYCAVGTGTTPPTVTDTQLANKIGPTPVYLTSQTNRTVLNDSTGFVAECTNTYNFPEGSVVGNISEFGIYAASSVDPAYFLVRSLIKDAGGNPTTITVLADEQLRIVHTVRLSCTVPLQTQTVTIGGVSTEIKYGRMSQPTNGLVESILNTDLARVFSSLYMSSVIPTVGSSTIGHPSNSNHVATSGNNIASGNPLIYKKSFTFSSTQNLSSGQGQQLYLTHGSGFWASFGFVFNPPIPKSNLNKFDFTLVITFTRG